MSRQQGTLVLKAGAWVTSALALTCGSSQATPDRWLNLEAQLYYSDRGTFSRDILQDSTIRLWNAHIGEGTLEGPTTQTLVTVVVRRDTLLYQRGRVHFRATVGSTVIDDRTVRVGIEGADRRSRVVFLLHGTACDPVELRARLLRGGVRGDSLVEERRARIPFRCGN
jgi:hypothetical protein